MVYYTWIAGFCPSSVVLNRESDLLPASGVNGREKPTELGPTETAVLNRGNVVDCIYRYGLLVSAFVT